MVTALDTLRAARAAGVHLEVDGGRLLASPRERLNDTLRAALRRLKPDLLALLVAPPLGAADRVAIEEHLVERAAIREFDGGQSHPEAESAARSEVLACRLLLDRGADTAPGWTLALLPGLDLADAHRHAQKRYGNALLAVLPQPLPAGVAHE
jgi:hypothetical protein